MFPTLAKSPPEDSMPCCCCAHTSQVRIAMVRNKVAPHVRDRVLVGTTLLALGHAGHVMSQDTSMGAGT